METFRHVKYRDGTLPSQSFIIHKSLFYQEYQRNINVKGRSDHSFVGSLKPAKGWESLNIAILILLYCKIIHGNYAFKHSTTKNLHV